GRPLSIATGYVNLGGLHHLAQALADDERPVRLLLGAVPQQGLGAELPVLAFDVQLASLAGERDFSRFPPSRAAERLQAVEAWLASGAVDERRDLLFPAIGLVDARTVYLRALAELYGEEIATTPAGATVAVQLASFQRDGYERARRILARHGGVVYADGVGTGKTEIGLAF